MSGDRILLGFARALRAAGVPVTGDRARSYLDAVSLLGLDDRFGTYAAGRATLCATPHDQELHDALFAAWFGDAGVAIAPPDQARSRAPRFDIAALGESPDGAVGDEAGDALRVAASATEVLRHRDVATLTDAERALMSGLLERLAVRPPRRRSARLRPGPRGRVDARRTLRATLRQLGEPAPIAWRRRAERPRRVVLMVDVSGSMRPYADVLLRLAHRMTRASRAVETFTVGTRLTHLTRSLTERDPDRALVMAGHLVPDWAGGTRLSETLQVFLRRWKGLARGAVVVIFSDGWERGDPALLGEQVAQLRRWAHSVIWVNPHRGKPGYEPVQGGIRAVLGHVDQLVAGHSLQTYERLMEVIGSA